MKKKHAVWLGMLCLVPLSIYGTISDSSSPESAKVLLVLSPEEEFGDMADYIAEDAEQSKNQPVIKEAVTYREIFERVGAYLLDVFLDAQVGIKKRYTLCQRYIQNLLHKA